MIKPKNEPTVDTTDSGLGLPKEVPKVNSILRKRVDIFDVKEKDENYQSIMEGMTLNGFKQFFLKENIVKQSLNDI